MPFRPRRLNSGFWSGTEREKKPDLIEVADLGCGVPPELQAKIFTPFFSTKKDGSGMGLAISKRIVELHQGKLMFRPIRPRGAFSPSFSREKRINYPVSLNF